MSTTAELLIRAQEALDERIAKARAGGMAVTAKGEKLFTVTNGAKSAYTVDFRSIATGVCSCEDFAARGKVLHACKHSAAVVLTQWPDACDRWETKIQALAEESVRALPTDPEPEPKQEPAASAPDPEPTSVFVTVDEALVAAAIEAAMPIVMEVVMEALASQATEIMRKTIATLLAARAATGMEVQK